VTEAELLESVQRLSPSRARVYAVMLDRGPVTDLEIAHALDPDADPGAARGRRGELVKIGLVRPAGRRGRQRLWETTPADRVESARESASRQGPRLRDISEHPLEVRVRAFQRLADDPEVQEAINDPASSARRRHRTRLRAVLRAAEQERRARERELRAAAENRSVDLEFIKYRNGLKDGVDRARAMGVLAEEQLRSGEEVMAPAQWETVAKLAEEGIEEHEGLYKVVARHANLPSRQKVDVELGDADVIEDAEVLELIATMGEGVSTEI